VSRADGSSVRTPKQAEAASRPAVESAPTRLLRASWGTALLHAVTVRAQLVTAACCHGVSGFILPTIHGVHAMHLDFDRPNLCQSLSRKSTTRYLYFRKPMGRNYPNCTSDESLTGEQLKPMSFFFFFLPWYVQIPTSPPLFIYIHPCDNRCSLNVFNCRLTLGDCQFGEVRLRPNTAPHLQYKLQPMFSERVQLSSS
jgi:hypothetical protein